MYQGDARNTGYAGSSPSPTENPIRAWEFRPEDNPSSSLAVANGVAVFGDAAGNVYALDSESGEEMWRFETVGEIESTGPAMTEELVITGSSGGTIYGLDVQTGEERWRFEAGGSRLSPAPLTIANGVVYVSGEKLYALNAETGEKRWESDFQPSPNFPVVATSFRIYAATFSDIIAVKPADGTPVWEFSPGGSPTGISFGDGTLYASDDANTVYALEGPTGQPQWRFETDDFARAPAVAGDTIYVASNQAGVYALDAETGAEQWRFDIPDQGSAQALPLVTDHAVYVTPSDEAYTYALVPDDGSERWRLETGQAFDPMALSEGTLYVLVGLEVMAIRTGSDQGTADTGSAGSAGNTDSDTQGTGDADTASQAAGDTENTGDASGDVTVTQDQNGRQRGFFSNSGNEPDFLTNPVNLTTLGFLLSVFGIAYQMLEGD